jgi:hypothetical protein
MKFAIDYQKEFKYLNDVDEINIKYRREDTTLLDFCLLHQEQRINIIIENEQDFIEHKCLSFFDAVRKFHPEINFALRFSDYRNSDVKAIVKELQEDEVKHKFYFNTYIRDWSALRGILELDVSDVYIVEDLSFELDKVAEVAHSAGAQVRIFPNVAQSSWSGTPALKQFFVRPEDTVTYEPFVDVMELIYGRPNTFETFYKVYAIQKKWTGKLNELIIGLKDDKLDSRYILPIFAEKRIKCGKRCMKKDNSCHICEAIEQLSYTLEEHNIIIKNKENN